MKALVGYTGFVGNNICKKADFDSLYNSKNIVKAYGTKPELLIYAGLKAEKYLANHAPDKDMEQILQAEDNIEKIDPVRLVLISTIDVFQNPWNVNELSKIDTEGLHPYGYNRYQLECWVRNKYPDALIIRLPALFGFNIKKNFIYDYINRIPFMLTEQKMSELLQADLEIKDYYMLQENGFYKVRKLTVEEQQFLKLKFKKIGFSALNFTDSRSIYQFYNLQRLWSDIQVALKNDIRLWHPATEPVSAGEVYKYLTGQEFVNELNNPPAHYDYKTIYDKVFGGENGYICKKEEVLKQIDHFIKQQI